MGIPAISQSWIISPNNHYVFASVQGALQAVAFSVKGFLKTTMGLTVKGSCTAGTGAMDGVDRWASASDVTPRNNGATGSQAWFVFTDGAGIDICMSYNATSDDNFRLAHSSGGLYVAAGTANQQPTATDECVVAPASNSWTGTSVSGDRVWHLWGCSDKKSWRAVTGRLSAFQAMFGTERVISSVYNPVSFTGFSPVVLVYMGSNLTGTTSSTSTGSPGSREARVHVNGIDANVALGGCGEGFFGQLVGTIFSVERTELQGGVGELMYPVGCAASASLAAGKLANHLDWWFTYSNSIAAFGDVFGNLQLLVIGEGIVLPWDGTTLPVIL